MEKRTAYLNLIQRQQEAEEILDGSDPGMTDMAKEELEDVVNPDIEEAIRFMLIPKDPEDTKISSRTRAGTGGDEASIFAGDLYRMYTKYCESK